MENCIYGVESFEKRVERYAPITHDIVRTVDVCVVGSGAAGAILATKLAEAGKSVILLEKGGYYDSESMNEREADMIPLLWKNAGANFTSNLKIAIAQGSCLGGSTVINDAVCFRIPDIVIEQWQKGGVAISKPEWGEASDEVAQRIHIVEVTEEELNENAKKLREACNKFQIDGNPIKHTKNQRNCGPSFTDSTLKSCVKCGFCHLGCHYSTKQSMLVTYIHQALNNPNVDFTAYCNCRVETINYKDGVASGVDGTFLDPAGNEKYRLHVNAKVTIVSAGSIASTNLLQRSGIGGDKVGRGLALHPAPFVMGHFEDEIHGNRGIPMSYTCHHFGVPNGIENGGFLIESVFLPIFQMAIAIPSFGTDHLRMMKEYNHYTMAGVLVRDEAMGTISLTYDGNPRVNYTLSPQTVNDIARGMAILARMWFDVGADYLICSHGDLPELTSRADVPRLRDAVRNNPDGLMLGSAHPQGGNKMGSDETGCVVDSGCRVFGFKNLYVCDASVFPTAVGVNPQLTVMALATITAGKILNRWESFENPPESLGKTCHISQPRFCSNESIGELYAVADHKPELFEKLVNSSEEDRVIGKNWKFDPAKLLIYNDVYWKGFYGRDTDALTHALRYFGGFYKRFWRADGDTIRGVTHPFETQLVDAKSLAKEKEVPGYGKVIHLEYQDFPYSTAYDLLKMVDENTIIGKAFLGPFGRGRELFNFSMSRTYDVEFMSEEELLTIFSNNTLSHVPSEREMAGTWEGMLVSNSAVSPRAQIFHFDYEDGEFDMRYSFANMLSGRSDPKLTDKLFRLEDPTPFHDEIRIATTNFAVGRWVTDWSETDGLKQYMDDFRQILPIPALAGTESFIQKISHILQVRGLHPLGRIESSFLTVEEDPTKGTRLGLSYILKRIT